MGNRRKRKPQRKILRKIVNQTRENCPEPNPGGDPGRLQRTLSKGIGIRKSPRNERKDHDPRVQVQIARRDDHHLSTRNIDVGEIGVNFHSYDLKLITLCKDLIINKNVFN